MGDLRSIDLKSFSVAQIFSGCLLGALFASLWMPLSLAQAGERVLVKGGTYSPLFREPEEKDRKIANFFMDKRPVAREQFALFLEKHPQFSKNRISSRMGDSSYLEGWNENVFPSGTARFPVTSVSWFAARGYCKFVGGRLPTVDEWEFAAQAQRPENLKVILAWYEKPSDQVGSVDALKPDSSTGLVGMHGLVWEWTEDFSSVLLQGDSRSSNETSGDAFCGAGALKAKRPEEYATFMRFAFRSSLKPKSSARALGFRCAYDK